MFETFETFLQNAQQPTRRKNRAWFEIGHISSQWSVLIGNLEANQPVANLSRSGAKRLLILMADSQEKETQNILKSVLEAIFKKNNGLLKLEPFVFQNLFQSYLSLERRFHLAAKAEGPVSVAEKDLQETGRFRGFLVLSRKLYSLNETLKECVFVYRRGSLLEFHLEPQHFIALEPDDLLMLAEQHTVDGLMRSGLLKQLAQQPHLPSGLKWLQVSLKTHPEVNLEPCFAAIRIAGNETKPVSFQQSQPVKQPPNLMLWLLGIISVVLTAFVAWHYLF
ncbi:MAG: hypothetical protein KTR14_01175 [Vampirovibrio sp.]|nr:hypothetical protein [Vampirovibrio sp.]